MTADLEAALGIASTRRFGLAHEQWTRDTQINDCVDNTDRTSMPFESDAAIVLYYRSVTEDVCELHFQAKVLYEATGFILKQTKHLDARSHPQGQSLSRSDGESIPMYLQRNDCDSVSILSDGN